MPLRRSLAPIVLASSLALAACGSDGAAPKSSDPAVTIDMNNQGFSPRTATVKLGDTVCWKNADDEGRWPASNIHPTHEIYSEFDPASPVRPGETWCFAFGQAGIWQFHDHLLPEFGGTVTVE